MTTPVTGSRQTTGAPALEEARGNGMSIHRSTISISTAQSSQTSTGLVLNTQMLGNEC